MAAAKLSSLAVIGHKFVMGALLLGAPLIGAAESDTGVPLNDQSKSTIAALSKMRVALAGIHPFKHAHPQSQQTKDGISVLYGNLFHTGQIHALVALSGNFTPDDSEPPPPGNPITPIGLGFAEWQHGSRRTRGLWRIFPVWRPKGWKSGLNGDFLPITPAEKPFWLKDLGGDGRPAVVVAGDVGKTYQEYDLLHFDRKKDCLEKVAQALAAPELVNGWVRLNDRSRRLSEFEAWTFLRWEGGKLIGKASWSEVSPHGDPERSYYSVVRKDRQHGDQTFDLHEGDNGETEITRNNEPFAKFSTSFRGHKPAAVTEGDKTYAETVYLFEKLTGLPRKLFPNGGDKPPKYRLEGIASIHVFGDAEAVRMLSP